MGFVLAPDTIVEVDPPPIPTLVLGTPDAPTVVVEPPGIPTTQPAAPGVPAVAVVPVVGPPGPAGPPGGSYFVYTQTSPAATWIIDHNLGRLTHTTVYDIFADVVYADVIQGSINQTTIVFAVPTVGSAVLS